MAFGTAKWECLLVGGLLQRNRPLKPKRLDGGKRRGIQLQQKRIQSETEAMLNWSLFNIFNVFQKKHFIVKVTFKMKKMTDVKIDSFFCRCQKVSIRTKITFSETFLTLFYFLPKKLVWRSRWRNFCKLFLKPKFLVFAPKLEKLNWPHFVFHFKGCHLLIAARLSFSELF